MPIKIVAIITPLPGKEEAVEALLKDMIAPTRAEPGNRAYDLWREDDAAGRFILDELYEDEQAVARHRQSLHFRDYLERIGKVAERQSILMRPCLVG